MSGIRLEAEVHLITGSVSSLKNLVNSIKMAGVEVEDLILDSLADSYSVLSEEERVMGTAVVDIGGDVAGLALFSDGSLRYSGVLLVGGEHVTNDIAIVQRMSVSEAETAKIREGSALYKNDEKVGETGPQASLFGEGGEIRYELASVIQSRMEEFFELVKIEFGKTSHFETIPAGIVLTGGGSKLGEICDLAETVFNRPTRVGVPRYLEGMSSKLADPMYSTVLGLVLYGSDRKMGRKYRRKNGSGVLTGVMEWFKVLKSDIV